MIKLVKMREGTKENCRQLRRRRRICRIADSKEAATLKKLKFGLTSNNGIDVSKSTLWENSKIACIAFRKFAGGSNICDKPHKARLGSKYLREVKEFR